MTSSPTIDDVQWRRRAGELAATLAAQGALPDLAWRTAFEQVPRHVFVPSFWALDKYNSPDRVVDGADLAQRDEWLDAVYSDRVLVTQWALRDGHRMASSSASLPTLVAHMLRLLAVRDGHRVLEIGTGTGYNTALLCHRVGDAQVTSMDIDPELIARATKRLDLLGYYPALLAGDGASGFSDSAPYDRILSTCAAPGVPASWIEQLGDGGVIVTPLTVGGALAVLTKVNATEVCGLLDSEQAWFMPLRPHSADPIPDGHVIPVPGRAPGHTLHRGAVDMDPGAFADPDFRLWLALHLPANAHVVDQVAPDDSGGLRLTGVIVHTDKHRADARFNTGDRVQVRQDSRRLFDHVAIAWREWRRNGCPERGRIGITARIDGTQNAWLDAPDSAVSWSLDGLGR